MTRIIAILALLALTSITANAEGPPKAPGQPGIVADGPVPLLMLPPAPVGEIGKLAWVGQAVHQNLLAEMAKLGSVQAIAPTTQPVGALDVDTARKLAAAANAPLVLFGSYQIADTDVRVTAQVLDVRNGKFLGSIKATGPVKDIFQLEDQLSDQLRRLMSQQIRIVSEFKAVAPVQPAQPQLPAQPAPAAPLVPVAAVANKVYPWEVDNLRRYDDDYRRSSYNYYYNYSTPVIWSGYYGTPWVGGGGSWGHGGHRYTDGGIRFAGQAWYPWGVIRVNSW